MSIDNGSFVSWGESKGRVDLIVSTGKVPGVEGDVEGTKDAPAARVVVWRDGQPTSEKVAVPTGSLSRIAPLDGSAAEGSPDAALVAMHAAHVEYVEHEDKGEAAVLTGKALMTAYERGLSSWPGADITTLTAEEWGLARAKHLATVAAGGEKVVLNDADLLAPEHPAHEGGRDGQGDETVDLNADEVESMIAAIRADSAVNEGD